MLGEVKLPTPWNQIEAAMAYSRGHPLLVIVEHGLKSEGLLEQGYDWYVQWVIPDASALTTTEFNGVLASWKEKLLEPSKKCTLKATGELTVGEIITGLKPGQLWSLLGGIAALVVGAFALGSNFFGK